MHSRSRQRGVHMSGDARGNSRKTLSQAAAPRHAHVLCVRAHHLSSYDEMRM